MESKQKAYNTSEEKKISVLNLADILEASMRKELVPVASKFTLFLGLALYPGENGHKSAHQDVSTMLTVAKYPIKQKRKTMICTFLLSVAHLMKM